MTLISYLILRKEKITELLWGKTLTVPQSLLTFYSNYSGAKCKRCNQEGHSRQPWLAVPAPHVRLLQVWTLTSKNFNLISKDSSYWPPKTKTHLNPSEEYVVVEGCKGRHRAVGKQSRIVALFGFGGQRLWQHLLLEPHSSLRTEDYFPWFIISA